MQITATFEASTIFKIAQLPCESIEHYWYTKQLSAPAFNWATCFKDRAPSKHPDARDWNGKGQEYMFHPFQEGKAISLGIRQVS